MSVLDGLNQKQREAASIIDGPVLILAGAGSGKTKTITTRLAYFIDEVGIPPTQTLTLTFTNKAAAEMRSRALSMITNPNIPPPLLCTFHQFGLMFLRLYMQELNRKNTFIVIDSNDRQQIIKDILQTFPLFKDKSPSVIESEISRFKNIFLTAEEFKVQDVAKNSDAEVVQHISGYYEKYLIENNLVDFDDLLLLPYRILSHNIDLCHKISEQYRYIMVDEYQDTNDVQNNLLEKICSVYQNLCVVGDDDQSIYSWRGADIQYILDFEVRYKDTKVVKLEQNYRSTHQILEVANRLIAHNERRLGKELNSLVGNGAKVEVLESLGDYEEIGRISDKIIQLIEKGTKKQDIAILFRLNALSRSIEEGLMRAGLPFKLIGTIRFYERQEIKDYIAYFRLIVNLHDNFSFSRIIDKPRRGIGKVSLQKAILRTLEMGCSLYDFSKTEEFLSLLGGNRATIIRQLFADLEELQNIMQHSIIDFIQEFDKKIPLKAYYKEQENGNERVENIQEFLGVIAQMVQMNPAITLEEILNKISLSNASDDILEDGDAILCMNIHASKGLEFKHVFVVGMEEGFFPLLHKGIDIEEERRLGYVACTRAKKSLTLSYVDVRFFYGKQEHRKPSRFLREMGLIAQDSTMPSFFCNDLGLKKGDIVQHKTFGKGCVQEVSKEEGREPKVKVNFGGLYRDILASFLIKIG
ncbi:ATP-dependent DNA helicase [Helicobacter monodelphidis]|uniref:ATP-dependent helicase n=1 Tax=Helicobacter sp. 15-1451 TaxID=2004995 RepID=UPI000DCBB3BC|nr:UvrD-helicase domain-containing protein [Helicobacter sp. 15-1451]RAX58227.1 ATP-dependent DNA helicase [Helicobacter sp. 15-1451]